MKKIKKRYGSFITMAALLFIQATVLAQDSAVSSTTTTTTSTQQTSTIQPWVWIVGGIIVLLIIISLFRGGSKDKVVITKERIKE